MISIIATTTTEEERGSRHVELGKGEVPYLSEDASNLFTFYFTFNLFTFMNVAIIILYLWIMSSIHFPINHEVQHKQC